MKKHLLILFIASLTIAARVQASNFDLNPGMITQVDQQTSYITIQTTSSYNFLSIYSENGALVKKVMIGNAGKNQVDVSDLANGTYSAVLSGNETGNGSFTINR